MIEFPNARNVFLPSVPSSIQDAALRDYLEKMKTATESMGTKMFDNMDTVRIALAKGVSGSFVSSDGKNITVVDGLITAIV